MHHDTGRFKCHRCKVSGDIFEWEKLSHPGISFAQARRNLAEQAKVPLKPPKDRVEVLTEVMAIYREELRHNARAQQFLLERGIEERTWFEANIGYAVGVPAGIPMGKMIKARLLNGDPPRPFFEHRIVFAVHAPTGDIVHMQGRTLGLDFHADAKYMALPMNADDGVYPLNHYLYGEDQLFSSAPKHKQPPIERVFLCEGVPDSLIVRQYGEVALAAFGNDNVAWGDHGYKLARAKEVYVLMDNDHASQDEIWHELKKLQMRLPDSQVYHVVLPKPEGAKKQDINDWYLNNGKPVFEVFWETVQACAKPVIASWIDYWAKDLKRHPDIIDLALTQPDPDRWLYHLSQASGEPLVALQYLAKIQER